MKSRKAFDWQSGKKGSDSDSTVSSTGLRIASLSLTLCGNQGIFALESVNEFGNAKSLRLWAAAFLSQVSTVRRAVGPTQSIPISLVLPPASGHSGDGKSSE
eukprot:g2966.t1